VLKPIEFGPLGGTAFVAPVDPPPVRPIMVDGQFGGAHFDDQYVGEGREPSAEPYELLNTDRAVGTRLAGDIARRQRAKGIVKPVALRYRGSAGQSFMAFAVSEMQVELEGDANDYVCKGLSGAHVAIYPWRAAEANGEFSARDSVIIGNTCLYGATSGRFFAAGQAGDRFGVRNSGAQAVIEGAGDHCCEYMTNGAVVVLGPTGINIGSGMTGGAVYLYAPGDDTMYLARLNAKNVQGRRVVHATSPAAQALKSLIEQHHAATGSKMAAELLADFNCNDFIQVVPPSEVDQPKNSVLAQPVNSVVTLEEAPALVPSPR
jgi:glutamate synthase (ferredoxin)